VALVRICNVSFEINKFKFKEISPFDSDPGLGRAVFVLRNTLFLLLGCSDN
jgi:hypothetical protein